MSGCFEQARRRFSNAFINNQLNQTYVSAPANPLTRLEPVNSTTRIIEDHVGFQGYTSNGVTVDPSNTAGLFDLTDATSLICPRPGDLPFRLPSSGFQRAENKTLATNDMRSKDEASDSMSCRARSKACTATPMCRSLPGSEHASR